MNVEHTARVWIDLPILVHGMTSKDDRADDGDICGSDKDICQMQASSHIQQPGTTLISIDSCYPWECRNATHVNRE